MTKLNILLTFGEIIKGMIHIYSIFDIPLFLKNIKSYIYVEYSSTALMNLF